MKFLCKIGVNIQFEGMFTVNVPLNAELQNFINKSTRATFTWTEYARQKKVRLYTDRFVSLNVFLNIVLGFIFFFS